ncbi:anti-sigma factor family protein [Burkholderia glumae]|uniref:anti-sigma factor family protein n=1 Tax=Burkholderia glumae TaxID=337 RepID=UPI0001A4A48E|nr:zf-HC2 domain-containing protein [Burkholderia glumae]ACR32758.1 Putative transmembrane anti-sigma factor [Burkholderia glumae BGR1]MCM2541678.1 zf-HC2 domain-containing protein [Burkholderia glumae]QGA41846.1 zf-HC2 domain-containing protein [Burkholderia glumae]QHP94740.1 zf-HC2 domain-containing protein [Burkholderia glumae]QHP94906.1 zf-HC2 domain-containing protein [Burkholderia glumae]
MSNEISTCRVIHRLIVERLDRTLSTDEASHVERHLSMCPDCCVFDEQMSEIRKACKALKEGKAVWPEPLRDDDAK